MATLKPIRGVSLLTYINEGGTTLRRPFEDVVFCMENSYDKVKMNLAKS